MTLNFQNKIIFPAPENSYTTETAYGQVIYLPRDIMIKSRQRAKQGYPLYKNEYTKNRVIRNDSLIKDYLDQTEPLFSNNPGSVGEKAKIKCLAIQEGKGDNDAAELSIQMDSPHG